MKVIALGMEGAGVEWDNKWDGYVLRHPQASGYHLLAWRRVIEKSFGHQSFYLMAVDECKEPCGVLPLVFLASKCFGRFLVSMPFVNYGGLLVDSLAAQGALREAAVSLAKEVKAAHIELRLHEAVQLDWPSKQHKVSMRLGLPREFKMLWDGFSSNLRSKIRRACKRGLTVRIGGRDILDDFYQVFSRNMRDLGTPVYGPNFFKTIVETFPNETRICTVYLKDRAVASGFLYGFRKKLELPWVSSDRRYNHLYTNMLLYSSMLEHACQEGFEEFDFGRSTLHSGTYRFKEQWGAGPVPLSWMYWTADARDLPDISPQNPKYKYPIEIWKRLPLRLANHLGPFVARAIP